MQDKIFYGDGTQPKRNTRILDLISQETKDRWKQEEEERAKPKTSKDLTNIVEQAKQPLKDFMTIQSDASINYLQAQAKASYDKIIERLNNGETIKSGDDDLMCPIPDLQQMLRQDGMPTILTLPTKKEGYKLRKM